MDNTVSNVKVTAKDSAISIKWDKASGASGYKILIYNDRECKKIYKTRYSDSTEKSLLGFTNGIEKYLTVTPFMLSDGKEVLGEPSEIVSFVPISKVFKVNRQILVLKKGDTFQLVGEKNNTILSNIDYSSSNSNVISVDENGNVLALTKGEAEILASYENETARVSVYVDREPSSAMNEEEDIKDKINKKCRIALVGDLMCTALLQRQKKAEGEYDFSGAFTRVTEYFDTCQSVIGVLETCISHNSPYENEQVRLDGGAPNCNSPAAFLDAIKAAGFSTLVTANNHCCDTGVSGLKDTLEQIKKRKLLNIGCKETDSEESVKIINANGVSIAVVAYNCVNNGLEKVFISEGMDYMLNPYNADKAKKEIETARNIDKVDAVIVYMHWGMMNSHQVNNQQRRIAQELAEFGADIIVGSHPHVVQECEEILARGKMVPCYYSLGNFYSSMSELTANRDTVLLQVEIEKGLGISISHKPIPVRIVNNNQTYYPVLYNDYEYGLNNEIQNSSKRTFSILNPRIKNTESLLKQMTLGRFVREINGRPNFDITPFENMIIEKNMVTYSRPAKSNSIYFSFSYNGKRNPCYNAGNDEIMRKNCRIMITAKPIDGVKCIVVPASASAYLHYAAWYRSCFNTKVIGITGSVGKTTVTGLVSSVLSQKYITDKTAQSKNVPAAVADNVLRTSVNSTHFVMEMASSQPNQIHKSSIVSQPDACLITRIGTAHIDVMKTQENICNTKFQILDGAKDNAPVFLNYDDPYLREKEIDKSHKIVSYAIDYDDVDYKALNIRMDGAQQCFDILYKGVVYKDYRINIPGKHNVYNALAAYAVGKWSNLTDSEIRRGLMNYRPKGMRQNIKKYNDNTLIIDCYNASLISVKGSLDVLSEYPVVEGAKKIAVLADMVSEGENSEVAHTQVGNYSIEKNIDLVVSYGTDSKYIHDCREKNGKKTFYSADAKEIVEYLRQNVTEQDVILFKGSRDMKVESIIEAAYPGIIL